MRVSFMIGAVAAAVGAAGFIGANRAQATDEHAAHAMEAQGTGPFVQAPGIPASGTTVAARLAASPRHGEWVWVRAGADSVAAWVVYPERRDKAPVVVVIHENTGLSTWARGVADQLAADGFIGIAADMLSMQRKPGMVGDWAADSGRALIPGLDQTKVQSYIQAVANYGLALPVSNGKYGIVGFCWGGTRSWEHAVTSASLGASVVYYGSAPAAERLASIKAPVLGLYGEMDPRIVNALPTVDSTMKALGKSFEQHVFAGAGHGFLGRQEAQNGANQKAAIEAWPKTLAFFRKHLGS